MEKRNSPRIPEETWKRYEKIIFHLYVIQNKALTAPGGVKDIMNVKYNFTATKAQYETRLKKWGFHKYRSANNRRATLSNISQGITGNSAIVRQFSTLGESGYAQAYPVSRAIPFRTPSPHQQMMQPNRPNLPSIVISSVSTAVNLDQWLTSDLDLGLVPIQQRRRVSVNHPPTGDPIDSVWHGLNKDDAIASTHSSVIHISSQSTASEVSPGEIIAGDLHGWDQIGSISTNGALVSYPLVETSLSGNFYIVQFADALMPIISQIMRMNTPSPHLAILKTSAGMRSAIDYVLEKSSYPSVSQLVKRQTIDFQIIYTVFHRLVNDRKLGDTIEYPQSEYDQRFKDSIEHVLSLGPHFLGNAIDSVPSLYKSALSQGLFLVALLMSNHPVLNAILDRVDLAKQPLWTCRFTQEYPLEYAARKKDLLAMRILLDRGADPNKHWQSSISLNLEYFMINGLGHHDTQIIALLLDHGLRIEDIPVRQMLMYWTRDELLLLVTHDLDQVIQLFLDQGHLPSLLLRFDWDSSLSGMLKTFLERGHQARTMSSDIWESTLTECLCVAVLLKRGLEAHLLLEMGAVPDASCLVSSVLSDDLLLLERFLDMGVDANALSNSKRKWTSDRRNVFTALSESIAHESDTAFEVFRDRGFVSKLAEDRRSFVPALIAACDIGNSTLVGTLLATRKFPLRNASLAQEIFRDLSGDLSAALERAIEEGHESICNQLLAAEIVPTASCLEAAYRTRRTNLVDALSDLVVPTPRIFCGAMGDGDKGVLEEMIHNGLPVDDTYELSSNDDDTKELRKIFGISFDWIITLLAAAVLGQSAVAVKVLLAHGARVAPQNMPLGEIRPFVYYNCMLLTPLAACVMRRNVPLLTELLYRGADPFDNSAIYMASVYGLGDIINLLLLKFKYRYPHGVKTFGSSALCWAISSRSLPLVEMLVKDVDISGIVDRWIPSSEKNQTKPFPYSIRRPFLLRSPEVLPIRMDYIPPPGPPPPPPPPPYWDRRDHKIAPRYFSSPLGEAIRIHCHKSGAPQSLHILLSHIRNFDAVVVHDSWHGRLTGLLYAIRLCSLDTFLLLAESGANIHFPAQRQIKRTALQFATELGHKEILEYLLMKGVSPNEPPAAKSGATSLQLAAIKGYVGLASVLLDAGAQVNAEPALMYGRTAFEGATEHGQIEMMVFLVQHDADLLSNDRKQYRRAVQLAKENGQSAAIQLAEELLEKVLASQATGFRADGSDWNMSGFGEFVEFDF